MNKHMPTYFEQTGFSIQDTFSIHAFQLNPGCYFFKQADRPSEGKSPGTALLTSAVLAQLPAAADEELDLAQTAWLVALS